MHSFLSSNEKLICHRLNFRIVSLYDTSFDGWLGAVLRNNFLYAAEQVKIHSEKQSLRSFIKTFTLSENHPLYKELKDGFPAPYIISLHSHFNENNPLWHINKNETISFSLNIVGSVANYWKYFIQAVQYICERGMGHPSKKPFLLLDVSECAADGAQQRLYAGGFVLADALKYPISLADYYPLSDAENKKINLKIAFRTPINLYKNVTKTDLQSSFQDKLNGFPSFYQLVRSTAYRLQKLNLLYAGHPETDLDEYSPDTVETFLEDAGSPLLISANLRHVVLTGTPKKERPDRIFFKGYTGEMIFSGKMQPYLSLLFFMQHLGVGDNIVFGAGRYEAEAIRIN